MVTLSQMVLGGSRIVKGSDDDEKLGVDRAEWVSLYRREVKI